MSAQPATLLTVAAYLTAAQDAFSAGNYTECRKQIILGQIELDKLQAADAVDGSSTTYRNSFSTLLKQVDYFEQKTSTAPRRSFGRAF